jgi:putative two-component system response regulator
MHTTTASAAVRSPAAAFDSAQAADFDRIARVATRALNVPVAQFNVVTGAELLSVSSVGPGSWQGPKVVELDASICQHVVRTGQSLVIDDARTHPLACENRALARAGIGAYVGVPVVLDDGTVAGTLCVVDFAPRQWPPEACGLLEDLAASLAARIALARQVEEHARARAYLDHVLSASGAHLYVLALEPGAPAQRWVSANLTDIAGYALDEALASDWWHTRVHPDDRPATLAAAARVRDVGMAVHEYRFRHRDGHYVWVRDEQRLVRDAGGRAVEIVGDWVDVSAQKAVEQALRGAHAELEQRVEERTAELTRVNADLRREVALRQCSEAAVERSEAHFRSLIEHAPDVIVLFDATGAFTYQSPSVGRLLGYPAGALLGTELFAGIHPEDRAAVRTAFTQILDDPTNAHRVAGRFRRADGSWRLFEAVGTNLLDDPAVAAVVINARDVTDRVEAAESLRASEVRFRTIFEQAGVGIAELDLGGQWLHANPRLCAILGYTEDELRARTFAAITHPDDLDADLEQFQRALAGEISHYQMLKRYVHREGHEVWVLLMAAIVCGPTGVPDYCVAVIEDVTDRQRASQNVRLGQLEVLERLAVASEFRDDDTGQHTQRVGELAARLAQMLELPAEQVDVLRRAAPLHDVGKIAIPDAVLLKPGRLTPDEYAIMKTHTLVGARILSGGRSPLVQMAERIAHSHHERWDGGGYPEGLAGEQIPLEARIVAVVDVFDALSSDRPYRPAWPRDRVLAEIAQGVGTHFDPRVARAFLRLEGVPDDGAPPTSTTSSAPTSR